MAAIMGYDCKIFIVSSDGTTEIDITDTVIYKRFVSLCHPSRHTITGNDAIPVEDDSVFSPRPEYVPAYVPVEMEEVDA